MARYDFTDRHCQAMKGYRRFQCPPRLSLWSSATVPVSVTCDIPGGIKQSQFQLVAIFVHVKPAIGLRIILAWLQSTTGQPPCLVCFSQDIRPSEVVRLVRLWPHQFLGL